LTTPARCATLSSLVENRFFDQFAVLFVLDLAIIVILDVKGEER